MGAQRKLDRDAEAQDAPSRPHAPALASKGASAREARANAVHDQLMRLEESFAPEPQLAPFPPQVRLAIMLGAPAVLWGLVIVAVGGLAHALGA